MRRRVLLVLALLLAPLAQATEASVVLLDWQEGRAAAGAAVAVEGVNARAFPISVDACHRRLLVDLLYEPENATVAVPSVGEASALYVFRLELRAQNATLATTTVRQPGYGNPLGLAPVEGDYEVRLVLTQGADVSWSLRVRGWEVPEEPACGALLEP